MWGTQDHLPVLHLIGRSMQSGAGLVGTYEVPQANG